MDEKIKEAVTATVEEIKGIERHPELGDYDPSDDGIGLFNTKYLPDDSVKEILKEIAILTGNPKGNVYHQLLRWRKVGKKGKPNNNCTRETDKDRKVQKKPVGRYKCKKFQQTVE